MRITLCKEYKGYISGKQGNTRRYKGKLSAKPYMTIKLHKRNIGVNVKYKVNIMQIQGNIRVLKFCLELILLW